MTIDVHARRSRTFAHLATESSDLLWPAIATAVRSLQGPVRAAAEAHFGWSSPAPEIRPSGKAVRPTLLMLMCEALGGRSIDAVPGAAAVELVHNATLIHDDVIDGDQLRRGRPALWTQVGIPGAILTGDALFFLAMQTLMNSPAPYRHQASDVLAVTVQELVYGEYEDVVLAGQPTAAMERFDAVVESKTAALFAAACRIGALAADVSVARADHAAAFGAAVGRAFQIADDLLGLWGDPALTGKPSGSDLANRRSSAPIVHALRSGTVESEQLASLFSAVQPLAGAQLDEALRLVEQTGAREWCRVRLHEHSGQAVRSLMAADPDSVVGDGLVRLVRSLEQRSR